MRHPLEAEHYTSKNKAPPSHGPLFQGWHWHSLPKFKYRVDVIPGEVALACNPSTREAEVREWRVPGQPVSKNKNKT
jgi:hypothetical protein